MFTMKRRETSPTAGDDIKEVILADPATVLRRLQQLGDKGLQAAMEALQAKDGDE